MKFILLVFLFMSLANPITGGKLFPGFNNPEKWMKRVIRKLQRKSSAYGQMIASNTAGISNNAGFISSIAACDMNYINDPDYGLSCCFEDTNNLGQCLCNGTTIDDTANPGSCCSANLKHPDHCLCSGTDMDNPNNPGNCCFKDSANPGQCLCNAANYTDDPNKRCFNLDWKGDGVCDDENNHGGCDFDGGDCCGEDVDTDLCTLCQCLEEEAPVPNAVGCCFEDSNNPGQCLCTGTEIDDPATPGSCCLDDLDNPGNCFQCDDSTTCNGNGTCISNTSNICTCNSGFTGDQCDIATCPGTPACSGTGTCPEGGLVCECDEGYDGNDCRLGKGTLIALCGGYGEHEIPRAACQVFDMAEPSKTCSNLADYPISVWGAVGGSINHTPLICGGKLRTNELEGYMSACYSHDVNSDSWTLVGNLAKARHRIGSGIVTDDGRLWVTGGRHRFTKELDTTEFASLDGTITSGPTLPVGRNNHCMVKLNSNESMIIGSREPVNLRKNTLIYNFATSSFTDGPVLNHMRFDSACTKFKSQLHGNREVILVASGGESNPYVTAELLDFTQENAEWTLTESLPITYTDRYPGSKALPSLSGQGVYLQFDSHFYEFTCDENSCQWAVMENPKIPIPKTTDPLRYSVMMYLSTEYTC